MAIVFVYFTQAYSSEPCLTDEQPVRPVITNMIRNMKLEEAENCLKDKRDRKPQCGLFASEENCKKRIDYDEIELYLKEVQKAKACQAVLIEAEEQIKTSNRATELDLIMNKNCEYGMFAAYPQDKLEKIFQKLDKEANSLPESDKNEDGSTNALVKATNECNSKMDWQYFLPTKPAQVVTDHSGSRGLIIQGESKAAGPFITKEACEIDRKKHKNLDSEIECTQIYNGTEITIKIAAIKYSFFEPGIGKNSQTLYFSDLQTCKIKTKNGWKSEHQNIGLKSSNSSSRFTSDCYSYDFPICKKGYRTTDAPREILK